jgi:hypothetical protein
MFGFACPLCWDKNCNCSQEALDLYYADINGDQPQQPFRYYLPENKNNKPLTKGDIFTTKIVDGRPIDQFYVKEVTGDNKVIIVELTTQKETTYKGGDYFLICSVTENN